jgi:hypothetical protein
MTPGAGHSASTDEERLAELNGLLDKVIRTVHLTAESAAELAEELEAKIEALKDRPSHDALAKAILIPRWRRMAERSGEVGERDRRSNRAELP